MTTGTRTITFDEWKRRINAICWKRYGVDIDDLPDCPFMDWYEDGCTPSDAANMAASEEE
jgi:hypothetical protein